MGCLLPAEGEAAVVELGDAAGVPLFVAVGVGLLPQPHRVNKLSPNTDKTEAERIVTSFLSNFLTPIS